MRAYKATFMAVCLLAGLVSCAPYRDGDGGENRRWESVAQFEQWFKEKDFPLLFPSLAYKVDCDDYATRLQRAALQDGYPISQALVWGGEYYGIRVRDQPRGHVGNLVEIAGIYYYVEPDPRYFVVIEIVTRD